MCALVFLLTLLPRGARGAQFPSLQVGTSDQPVRVAASHAERWIRGSETVVYLEGPCSIRSGPYLVAAEGAVLWLVEDAEATPGEAAVDVYAERNVRIVEHNASKPYSGPLYVRMRTRIGVRVNVRDLPETTEPPQTPLYENALRARFPDEPLPWKPPGEEEMLFAPKDVHFVAASYSFERDEKGIRATLHGDARLELKDMRLFADDVILWIEQAGPEKQAWTGGGALAGVFAEGCVVVFSGTSSVRADRFYLDTVTYEGIATNAIVRTNDKLTGAPFTFASPEVRELDRNTMLCRTGYISSCEFAEPHYRIEGHNMRAVQGSPRFSWSPTAEAKKEEERAKPGAQATPGEPGKEPTKTAGEAPRTAEARGTPAPAESPEMKEPDRSAKGEDLSAGAQPGYTPESLIITSHDNVVYIGPYSIFYWPYAARDVRTGGFLLREVQVGHSGEFGAYIKTAWNPYDLGIYYNEWSDATLHLDYYGRRGMGTGLDFEYEGPTRFGFFTGYYIHDRADTELEDIPVTHPERGRLLWRHRELLEDDWRADIEFAYRSDRNFLPAYFEKEYFEGKPQETLLYLRKLDDNRAYTALVNVRVNQFDNYVERLPELGLHWLGEPFWQDRLLWSTHTSLSDLRRKYDNALKLTNPDPTTRFDTANEVSYPLSLDVLQVEPFVGADLTAFSNQARADSAAARFAATYGLRVGTDFYRTYDAESDLFNIHGIRHILTPTLNYAHLFYITDPPGKYIQYDRSIDARDLSEEILFRLRNRWQTKRGEPDHLRSVDFLTLDLDFNFFPGKAGSNLGRDDFIELNTKWRVNDNVTLSSSRTRYDLARSQFNLVNFGVELTYWQPIAIAYSHDFIRPPDPRRRTKSISTLKLAYRPTWSRWQIELQESYDFNGQMGREGERNPKVLSSAIALTRELHCWQLILSAEANKGWGANTSLSIHLRPTFLTARTVEL